MVQAHRRHDLSDRVWQLLEPRLPGREGAWGGVAKDNRLFINAVFWIMRMGAPRRDLPPDLGDWSNAHGNGVVVCDYDFVLAKAA